MRRSLLCLLVAAGGTIPPAPGARAEPPALTLGYTEYRTNLPGGRHANVATMRACVVRGDGTGRRLLAEELTRKPDTWTQFAGWSPDGRLAILGSGWESPANAAWEEKHQTFRMTEGWLYDMYLLDPATGGLTNLTAVERVSPYNSGLFFWPKEPSRLGFQALIDGNSHPFRMDRDGRNKKDLTQGSREFAYGYSASPDGRRIAYHKSYQIYLANADGSGATRLETQQPFNFVPQWSPDGRWLTFLAGEHYHCHPYLVKRDGSGLRKLADRHGYQGVVEFLDVPDFHGGSSDVPVWSPDSRSVYFTARFADRVEVMRTSLEGRVERLTRSRPGVLNYHPTVSPDGKWVAFGSRRDGARQLYVMRAGGEDLRPVTHWQAGRGAMWPYWQPVSPK